MIVLFDFCSCHWLLPWLLPFLLGLLLGWLLWARYQRRVRELEDELTRLRARIKELEDALADCRSGRAELEGELALLRGRIREIESADDTQNVVVTPIAPGIRKDKFAVLTPDNLQVIEGIGPKMESVLKENGVHTWGGLAAKSSGDCRGILDKYGDRYRIIDPDSWPAQAELADAGKWDELIAMQKQLDAGRGDTATGETDSKVEKMLIKLGVLRRWKQDDLKAIEGIGPKIEGLMHDAGIRTWREMANTAVSRLQDILNAAGDRYRLADPSTWPKQAEMAANGQWDELEEYQEFLQGGREN